MHNGREFLITNYKAAKIWGFTATKSLMKQSKIRHSIDTLNHETMSFHESFIFTNVFTVGQIMKPNYAMFSQTF
jgi:hypothetical protein